MFEDNWYTFGYEYGREYVIFRVPPKEVIHMYEPIEEDEQDTIEVSPTVSIDYFPIGEYVFDN